MPTTYSGRCLNKWLLEEVACHQNSLISLALVDLGGDEDTKLTCLATFWVVECLVDQVSEFRLAQWVLVEPSIIRIQAALKEGERGDGRTQTKQ